MMHGMSVDSGDSDDEDGVPLVQRRARRPSVSSSRTVSSRNSLDGDTGFGTGKQTARGEGLRLRRPREMDNDSTIELDNLSGPIRERNRLDEVHDSSYTSAFGLTK